MAAVGKRVTEAEIIRAVADLYTSGLSVAEIAAETSMAERTVKQYLHCANVTIDEKVWIEGDEAAQLWARDWDRERRKWIK